MTKKGFRAALALATLVTFGLLPVLADFEQAMSYFKGGKYVEAAAEFQALVDQSPDYADGYQMLGLSFLQMKKPEEAIQAFQKAIELNGDRFEFHHGLASAYYAEKDFGKAVGSLRTAEPLATAEQQKYHLYSLRGLSYVGLEKWDDAIADLEKAKAIRATPTILDRLGLAYYQLGHADKAVPVLEATLKSDPGNAASWLMLTNGLLDLGAGTQDDAKKAGYYKRAMDAAQRYQKLKPASYEADNLVGRAAFGARDFATAERAFQKVLEKRPDYCYAMANLGKLYISTEKWTAAEKILREGTKCDPRMAVMYENLGYSLQKQRKLDDAIAQYNKAQEIKPTTGVAKLIETCQRNIEIAQANQEMDAEEAANKEEIERQRRLEEEERKKAAEWEKRTRDD